MSSVNDFINNVVSGATHPKGNVGDFAHAALLFNSGNFNFSPKVKFLYHVIFNLNPVISNRMNQWTRDSSFFINLMVKDVELPKFKMEVSTVNQYNRKKNVQTKLTYEPIKMTFHDDNVGIMTKLWQLYYSYYFADTNNNGNVFSSYINNNNFISQFIPQSILDFGKAPSSTTPAAFRNNAYSPRNSNRYGLDNDSADPFFTSIQIFQLSRHRYQAYTLVRPIFESWSHSDLNSSKGGETCDHTASVKYESVFYNTGAVSKIPNFGYRLYDHVPSPLTIAGGGTATLTGPGGVLDGTVSILSDIMSGYTFGSPSGLFGTLVKGINLFNNSQRITSNGLASEATYVASKVISSRTGTTINGVSNIAFPTAKSAAIPQTTNNYATLSTVGVTEFFNSHPGTLATVAQSSVYRTYLINNKIQTTNIKSQWNALSATQKQTFESQALNNVIIGEPLARQQYLKVKESVQKQNNSIIKTI